MTGLVVHPGLFRLLLALAVVASHLSGFEIGRLAVLMFFFLSGYWVTKLWNTRFAPDNLAMFYGSRWFRIWPLYILCTIAAAMLAGQAVRPIDFALLGVATTRGFPLYVSWSLDVEMQFYLIVPFVAWVLAKPWRAAQGAMVVLLTVAGWLAFFRYGVVSVAQYLPTFALGALACIYDWKPSRRAAYVSLVAFGLLTIVLYFNPLTHSFLRKDVADPFDTDILSFFWMLPLLPYIGHSLLLKSGAFDRHLGGVSYPVYLAHVPILLLMRDALGDSLAVKVLAVTAATGFSVLVYMLVDRPIDVIRQRVFEPRRPRLQPAPADGGRVR